MWVVIGLLVVIGGALAVVRWAFDFSVDALEREDEEKTNPIEPDPAPKRSYIDSVLRGFSGPSGTPGGFSDPRAEHRYTELVRTADSLESAARGYAASGEIARAHAEVGRARALREAARWLLDEGEPTWASDWLLSETSAEQREFRERERMLDDQVRAAVERTKSGS